MQLSHEFADDGVCNQHVQGWRYQMAVFGNVTANEAFGGAADLVDGWFAAWSDPESTTREAALDRVASPDISFRDQFSLVAGLDDLRPHLAAVHRFMPGLRLMRDGAVRHCQGTVLADWVARGEDGSGARPRHERVRVRSRRPHRVRDRILERGEAVMRTG